MFLNHRGADPVTISGRVVFNPRHLKIAHAMPLAVSQAGGERQRASLIPRPDWRGSDSQPQSSSHPQSLAKYETKICLKEAIESRRSGWVSESSTDVILVSPERFLNLGGRGRGKRLSGVCVYVLMGKCTYCQSMTRHIPDAGQVAWKCFDGDGWSGSSTVL